MKRTYPVELLIVDRGPEPADRLVATLRESGLTVRPRLVTRGGALTSALEERSVDIVLVSTDLEPLPPDRVAAHVHKLRHDAVVIGVSPDVDGASGAGSPRGVADVVPRERPEAIARVVMRELRALRERRALAMARRALADTTRTMRELMESSPEAIAFVVHDALAWANPAFRELFGFEATSELRGVPIAECVEEHERSGLAGTLDETLQEEANRVVIELDARARSGVTFPADLELSPMILEGRRGVRILARARGTARDRPAGKEPAAGATPDRDARTGLWTREALVGAVATAATDGGPSDDPGALVYVELEDYARLRAAAGLTVMDGITAEAAARLRAATPGDALCARVADDAFAILLPPGAGHAPPAIAKEIEAALGRRLFEVGSRTVMVGCRTGISALRSGNAHTTLEHAFAEAHRARTEAEVAGTDEGPIEADVEAASDIAAELRGAAKEGRLSAVFQPIVRLHGDPIELYEVFLRLRARNGTMIPASEFFKVADQEGLIVELDRWAIEHACTVLGERHAEGRETHLFVKLSKHAMAEMGIPITIRRLLRDAQVPPERLIVEISESAVIADMKSARAFMRSLRQIGCRTALEHFGVSFNSFDLLEHVPADFLKVDSTLVAGLASDAELRTRVAGIASKVHARGSHTIAERLEDPSALAALFTCRVEFAQGYYIQEPTESLDFEFDIELA